MLQNLGDKLKGRRSMAIAVIGPLAVIFALWGAYGVVSMSFGAPDYGLKVNDERISIDTLNRAWQQRQAQYQQSLNGAEMTDAQKTMLQQQLIDEYVRQTLLRQRAQQAGYRATDTQVIEAVRSEPAFQLDGKYDPRVARNMLAQIGLTEDRYFAERREALQIGQLSEAIELSDFLTPAELDRIYALENEQRELRYALLTADHFQAAVKIDDAKIKSWYESHPNDYMSPESVRLQYAELRLDSIASQLTVTPEDLRAYYDKNQSRYGEIEKRHAHHILIALPAGADAKADGAALAKAQEVVAQLKAGKDFSELSKKYSADPGSATRGGDLGWADKATYVASFADALFSMQPGQISDPVKTQYGYHIIRLDDIRPAHVRSFDEAHAQIESEYRRDQAAEIFGDRQEQLQQKLESGASGDLDALARPFGLQTGEIKDFTRSSGGPPLGGKQDLLRAVFNDDVIASGKIAGPVALADDHLVVFKVLEHRAPAPQPIASVREEIIAAIRKSESTAAAKAAADDALNRLEAGAGWDEVAKSLGVKVSAAAFSGRSDPQLPAQVRQAAFAAPRPAGKPVYRALALDNGGAALLAITAIKAGTAGANPQNDEQLISQYMRRDREGDMRAYLLELQRRATVKTNPTIFQ
ncbi:MAG TPA: peptidyl-prolyl cis-trans isomerase [Steroidobacteraceae bacterium]|nr:peptidyl-prolyl cis-trans isomerase [Steroidobacteraceae bacterium]